MTKTPLATVAALASVALIAWGTTACSGSGSDPTSDTTPTGRGGTSAQPVAQPDSQSDPTTAGPALTLRLGTDDGPKAPGARQVTHFAAEVAELSGGAITIEPVWSAADHQPHFDQYVAHLVQQGRLDLGMVPSRAWDELGVTSLTALTAPFLITTDTLTDAVVTDDELADQLTSGLPAVGVSALGLFPEGLRHPFGFQHLLGGAADYRGGELRAPYSGTTEAMFAALGATTSDDVADTAKMIGAESSYRLSPAGTATGNVTFFPKVNVLSLGSAARKRLSGDQLRVLQRAADATRDWAVESRPTDAEAAATFCGEAGRIGAATPAEVDSLVAATRPVIARLRQAPLTAKAIDEIQQLAASDPPADPVTACSGSAAPVSGALNGTYAFTITASAARAAGLTDQNLLDENAGDFTFTFADGTWSETQVYSDGPKAGRTYHATGGYTLDGPHLEIFWSHEPGDRTTADVTQAPDGSLGFTKVADGGGPQFQALDDATFTHWERLHA